MVIIMITGDILRKITFIQFVIVLVLSVNTTTAQEVLLEKIQRGDNVVVFAENKSNVPQLVSLDLTLENVISDKEFPLEVIVKPGEKKELIALSPIPLKAWSYKTRYSFEEYIPDSSPVKAQFERPRIPNNEPPAKVVSERSQVGTPPVVSYPKPDDASILVPDEESNDVSRAAPNTSSKNKPVSINKFEAGPVASSEESAHGVYSKGSNDYFMLPPSNTDDAPTPGRYARKHAKIVVAGEVKNAQDF